MRAPARPESVPAIRSGTLAFLILLLTLARLAPIGAPVVFSDEYSYAVWTKHLYEGLRAPTLAPTLGNWLYLRLFEFVHFGQGEFLQTARAFNAVCAAVCGWALFLLARRWVSSATAALLAASYSVMLVGSYAAYFMPEAMFFSACAVLALVLYRYLRSPGILAAIALGVVGALVTAVKEHGLLLLPAIVVGVVVGYRAQWKESFSRIAIDSAVLVLSWWLGSILIGGLLGHVWALSPLGSFYTDVASSSASKLELGRLTQVLVLGTNHLSAVMLTAGFPLTVAAVFAAKSVLRPAAERNDQILAAVVTAFLCAFAGMLAVSVLFTVSLAGSGPYETITRLHGRYYEHLLVLTAALGVLAAPRLLTEMSALGRWILAAIAAAIITIAALVSRGIVWQNFNDFASAYAIFAQPAYRYYAWFIAIAAIGYVTFVPRNSHIALASGLLLWSTINAFETERLRYALEPQAGDRSGEVIAQAEAGGDRAHILVLAPAMDSQIYRLAFHLLDEDVQMQVGALPPACPSADSGVEWLVVVGKEPGSCNATEVADFGDMKVRHIAQPPH